MMNVDALRSEIYSFFATLFHYPGNDEWNRVTERVVPTKLALKKLGVSCTAFDRFAAAWEGNSREEAGTRFIASFIHGRPTAPAPLYESLYGPANLRLSTMMAVREFYSLCGVEPSAEFADMPDGLSTELEFMHYMAVEKMNAGPNRTTVEELERTFLVEHVEKFASSVAHAVTDDMFVHAAHALRDFVLWDVERARVSENGLRT